MRWLLVRMCLLLAWGCSPAPAASGPRPELLVQAAVSTRDALLALEPDYEREHGVELVFNFGASGDLAGQILAGAPADLFLSADEEELRRVEAAGLVRAGTRRELLSNQLVVIEPATGPSLFTAPFAPGQLAAARLLSIGDPASVPAGRYARAWLEAQGLWSRLSERILPAVDARAAVAAVAAGGAEAGIVYRTDAALSERVRLVHAVPLAEGPRIVYPLAVLAGRPEEPAARAFAEFLASPAAGAAFEERGFVFLAGPTSGQ